MSWQKEDNKLVKDFEFDNFLEVVDAVNKIADIAEEHGHHPDLLIHDYKKLKVMTTTHDAGKLTEKDYKLSEAIDDELVD